MRRWWKIGCVRKCPEYVRKRPVHFIVSRALSFYNIVRGEDMDEYFETLDFFAFDVEKTAEIINEILEEAGLDE